MSSAYFIILSGAYICPELVAEFGNLPPAFLPNGGRRLYEDQLKQAAALNAQPIIVLPDNYPLPHYDMERIEAANIHIERVPPTASILESLSQGLASVEKGSSVYVLFGDTLIESASPWPQNGFAAGGTHHLARWSEFEVKDGQCVFYEYQRDSERTTDIVAGFFNFHNGDAFKGLVQSNLVHKRSFIEVLNEYAQENTLEPIYDITWLDFGHLYTYHQSRCRELLARSFNSIVSDGCSVVKTGTPERKIFAEAEWFRNLPPKLRPYTPHFIDAGLAETYSYELEYLYFPLISELFCFGRLPGHTWELILGNCMDFLGKMQSIRPKAFEIGDNYPAIFFNDMIQGKTGKRLETFARDNDISLTKEWRYNGKAAPSLQALGEELIAAIPPTTQEDITMWHGDFHFGNIFYNFRSNRVNVVDPRGMLSNGTLTMFGDARYDISKLGHSIFGFYDFLIADRFDLQSSDYNLDLSFGSDPAREHLLNLYKNTRVGKYACMDRSAIAMTALLFLSMLPLHTTNKKRQKAILANAFRLKEMMETSA
ncbi:phosphotransferase [Komagataeibacter saccharivorans]|uniref:phosphotransferase n=1 Tax=Komagataeibacter saccharivorans TaxID=265959 RepID=UPI0024A92D14|nr:phosphotransferase [Komagataeibacter saccharivorans]